jgi:hypothetical protein
MSTFLSLSESTLAVACCPGKGVSEPRITYSCTLGNVNLSELLSNPVHAFFACTYDYISPIKFHVTTV